MRSKGGVNVRGGVRLKGLFVVLWALLAAFLVAGSGTGTKAKSKPKHRVVKALAKRAVKTAPMACCAKHPATNSCCGKPGKEHSCCGGGEGEVVAPGVSKRTQSVAAPSVVHRSCTSDIDVVCKCGADEYCRLCEHGHPNCMDRVSTGSTTGSTASAGGTATGTTSTATTASGTTATTATTTGTTTYTTGSLTGGNPGGGDGGNPGGDTSGPTGTTATATTSTATTSTTAIAAPPQGPPPRRATQATTAPPGRGRRVPTLRVDWRTVTS